MKFDWIEYFTIAQTLSSIAKEQSSPEAALRSSISRDRKRFKQTS